MFDRDSINRLNKFINKKYIEKLRSLFKLFPSGGVDILREDWDFLVVLDACRFDTFKQYSNIEGNLSAVRSRASNTSEWLRKNFPDEYDLTYVSANPHISNRKVSGFRGSEHFSHVENVWEYGWSEDLDTVPPENVTNATIRLLRERSPGRMIIHYVQPHGPWIGDTKINIEKYLDQINTCRNKDFVHQRWNYDAYAWELVKMGKIKVERLREAYVDNLKLVLSEVERLIKYLEGDIVITSDHGESFGEMFVYEHPEGIYTEELVKVPWLEINKNDSQTLPEQPEKNENHQKEQGAIKNRLESLGYL